MRTSMLISFIVIVLLSSSTILQAEEINWRAEGRNGALVAGDKEAVEVGLEIFKKGGNAIDVTAATILALTVTDYRKYFCFGSEVPIIVYDAKRGVVEVLCGQGPAPELATREHFMSQGNTASRGIESWTVPGVLDACLTALDRYGTMRFVDVSAPMLRILDRHEEDWHARFAKTVRRLVEAEKGARDRKRGLRLVADYFYRGPIAREIDEWSRENGGLIRYSDLARYMTRIEEPITVNYRGYTVYKCGPWSQGPVMLQALQLLEGYDLAQMGHSSADFLHVVAESMKLAYADRDAHYGDPLFSDVPMDELLSAEYTQMRRELIDMQRASVIQQPGDPLAGKAILEGYKPLWGSGESEKNDTSICIVADRWGNMVASTPSGNGVPDGHEVGSNGVKMGNRMLCFNIWEGHPNCVEPGKRPRTTLTPTLVLKDGKPVLVANVAGGDLQDQSSLQMLINHLDFGMDPAQCVTSVPLSTGHMVGSFGQGAADLGSLGVRTEVSEDVVEELKARGHKVQLGAWGSHDAILTIDPESGLIRAAGYSEDYRPRAGAY
ncbi:gamma-glutamyltransferase family protein [Planctomycetota bacterium]